MFSYKRMNPFNSAMGGMNPSKQCPRKFIDISSLLHTMESFLRRFTTFPGRMTRIWNAIHQENLNQEAFHFAKQHLEVYPKLHSPELIQEIVELFSKEDQHAFWKDVYKYQRTQESFADTKQNFNRIQKESIQLLYYQWVYSKKMNDAMERGGNYWKIWVKEAQFQTGKTHIESGDR
jgi:hypothetical protein